MKSCKRNVILIIVFILCSIIGCSKVKYNYVDSSPKPIVWDTASKMRISEPEVYGGYARLIELQDGSLFAVYSNASGIVGKRSHDKGKNWGALQNIISNNSKNFATNAEVNQLDDGSIMVWANYRVPENNTDTSRRLKIGYVKSTDNGNTWSTEKIVFTAAHLWTQGCWEPKALQLPSGEVQVYFANEFPYGGNSFDQEISILSSFDRGDTWTTEPKKISYRQGSRDGMPAPVLLKNKKEIVMVIEDNGYGIPLMKPSIIRTALENNWSAPVLSNSPDREYALLELFPLKIGPASGAPYLAQLQSGQTILSCQSMYNRPINGLRETSVPLVGVGDENARNFQYFSQPFTIPGNKTGLWNSVAVLSNDEILLLTTTNAYSSNGAEEVWMMRGRLKMND